MCVRSPSPDPALPWHLRSLPYSQMGPKLQCSEQGAGKRHSDTLWYPLPLTSCTGCSYGLIQGQISLRAGRALVPMDRWGLSKAPSPPTCMESSLTSLTPDSHHKMGINQYSSRRKDTGPDPKHAFPACQIPTWALSWVLTSATGLHNLEM